MHSGWQVGVSPNVSLHVASPFCCISVLPPCVLSSHLPAKPSPDGNKAEWVQPKDWKTSPFWISSCQVHPRWLEGWTFWFICKSRGVISEKCPMALVGGIDCALRVWVGIYCWAEEDTDGHPNSLSSYAETPSCRNTCDLRASICPSKYHWRSKFCH